MKTEGPEMIYTIKLPYDFCMTWLGRSHTSKFARLNQLTAFKAK